MLNRIINIFGKVGMKVQAKSPEILCVVGVVGVVSGVVLACRATTKLPEIEKEASVELDMLGDDEKKEKLMVYVKTSAQYAKIYAPSVIVTGVGIACLLGSTHILKNRLTGVTVAYNVVKDAYDKYRARVIADHGDEYDQNVRRGVMGRNIVVNDDGTVDHDNIIGDINGYMRCFDEGNENYSKDSQYNYMFLKSQQQFFNDKLRLKGFVFLNDVYEALGFKETPNGQVEGWIYREDARIDFGFDKSEEFVQGLERSVWLEIIPQGIVHTML